MVTNRVNQFRIAWHGSSPTASLERFLQCDDPWFRPVDVKLGPDGALYVADFYNRIIGHYEVPLDHPGRDRERGRIWRIVYKGPEGKYPLAEMRDWTKATVGDLVEALGHPTLTVRLIAANQLVERGGKEADDALRPLLDQPEVGRNISQIYQRAHALWVLDRHSVLTDELLTRTARASEVQVRVHTQRLLGERTKWTDAQHGMALTGLKDASAHVQRAAADALGRHPAPANIVPVLDLLETIRADDTHLRHVARMALRDHMRLSVSWETVNTTKMSDVQRDRIADVALGVPSAEAAAYLVGHIKNSDENRDFLQRAVQHAARYGAAATKAPLLGIVIGHRPNDLGLQVALLKALERGTQERGAQLDAAARTGAARLTDRLLESRNGFDVLAGIELVGSLRLIDKADMLAGLATSRTAPEPQRAAAAASLANVDAAKYAGVLGGVLGDSDNSVTLRESVSGLLAKANQPEMLDQLVKALTSAPARLQNKIAADLAGSPAGAGKLLDAVAAGKASAPLLQERAVEVKLANSKLANVKERVAKLTKGLPAADEKIQDLTRQPRCSRRAAPTATSSAARARRSARSSTVSACAGWTGCSRTCSTRTATSIKRFA